MKKVAKAFKRRLYADYTMPRLGFLKGDRIRQLVHAYTYGKPIEELRIPLGIVCDLQTGENSFYERFSVRSRPREHQHTGRFRPAKMNGRMLVDGAVVDRIPVSAVKDMGADIVIASDVSRVKNGKSGTYF